MAFAVVTEKDIKVIKYIKDTQKRLKSDDLVKNPFKATVKVIKNDDNNITTLFNMVPIWPNFPPIVALIMTVGLLMVSASPWLFIIPLVFLALGFFWTDTFYYAIFKTGLKKAGYEGHVKKIKTNEIIEIMSTRF